MNMKPLDGSWASNGDDAAVLLRVIAIAAVLVLVVVSPWWSGWGGLATGDFTLSRGGCVAEGVHCVAIRRH
jgi:hypothetical protein